MSSLCWIFLIALTSNTLYTTITKAAIQPRKRLPITFTTEQKEAILALHNHYRKNAKPQAADMRLLTWNATAEKLAQLWAENCQFKHGMPFGYEEVRMGQNLYIGGDKDGLRATVLWWNESYDYDIETDKCAEGAQCGHYTQMMWATSERLGCAISACPLWNLIVCHYDPPGNYIDEVAYIIGKPCSQCMTDNGGTCSDGLCVTEKECKLPGISQCTCPLTCHNCGVLDKDNCRCVCKDGWDSLDCSQKCEDIHEWCRQNPGFPDERSCSRDSRINDTLCRAMCGQCKLFPKGFPRLHSEDDGNTLENVCITDYLCPAGQYMDANVRACRPCSESTCGSGNFEFSTLLLGALNMIPFFLL